MNLTSLTSPSPQSSSAVFNQTVPYDDVVTSADYLNVTVFNISANSSSNISTVGPPEPPDTCPAGFFCRQYTDLAQIFAVQIFFIIFYVVIILLAVMGNAMVVWTVWRNKKMRTVTNYFILNLAATDFVVGFVALLKLFEFGFPIAVTVFSVPLCTALNFLQPVFVGASMLTLVAVSFERFNAICRPLDTKFTSKRRIVGMLVAVWLVPMVLWSLQLAPAAFFRMRLESELGTITRARCLDNVQKLIGNPIPYHITLFLVLYALPLLFITVVCVRIVIRLRSMETPGSQLVNDRDMARKRDKNKKMVTRMVIAVAAAFAVCWTPFYVMTMAALNPATNFIASSNLFFWNSLMYGLGFLNSAINPVIYIIMSDKFRRGFRDVFYTLCCCIPCRRLCRCKIELGNPTMLSHSSTSAPNQSVSASPRRNLAVVSSPKLVKKVSFAKDVTLATTVSKHRTEGMADADEKADETGEETATRASPGVKRKITWRNPARERRWLKLSWRRVTKRVSSRSNADSGVYSITGEPPDIATHDDLCNELPQEDENQRAEINTDYVADVNTSDSLNTIHDMIAVADVNVHIHTENNGTLPHNHGPERTVQTFQDAVAPEGFEIAPGYDQYSSEEEDTVVDFTDIPDFQEYCYTLAPALPKKPLKRRGFHRTSASLTNAVEV